MSTGRLKVEGSEIASISAALARLADQMSEAADGLASAASKAAEVAGQARVTGAAEGLSRDARRSAGEISDVVATLARAVESANRRFDHEDLSLALAAPEALSVVSR